MNNFVVRECCPLCDGKSSIALVDKPFYNGPIWEFLSVYYEGRIPLLAMEQVNYVLTYCQDCDFYWQKFILGPNGMNELYDNWINSKQSHHKKQVLTLNRRIEVTHKIAKMLKCLDLQTGYIPQVLDFGGGWGEWCFIARALGCEPSMLELSEHRRQHVEAHGIRCVRNLTDLKLHSFDLINAEQVFEHITNPVFTLQQLSQITKVGGFIHIGVPNAQNGQPKRAYAKKGPFQPLEHINGFTPSSLNKLLTKCGFKVVTLEELAILLTGTAVRRLLFHKVQRWTGLSQWNYSTSVIAKKIVP